ncbi:MAG: protein kinase [Cyanobacteriota bacterium]|nr:protein kinase [Cyanobacteriota bacterium]
MLGKKLRGRYEIIRPLGSGGFGKTYLARDRDLPGNPDCVVKQFQPQSNQPEILKRSQQLFQREAEILYQLGDHDQIPRLLAHFEEEEEFYAILEYIQGHDLTLELQPGKQMADLEVISLLKDVLSVLEFVHQKQIIHRDIKPSNLIRRQKDNELVLIDFGAVKQVEIYNNIPATVIGTPGYMSPEQARGKPQFSSDLYALGVIGIQALTGVSPHQLLESSQTENLLWRDRLTIAVHPTLMQILERMVDSDIRQRYQTATSVLNDLSQINVTVDQSFSTLDLAVDTLPTHLHRNQIPDSIVPVPPVEMTLPPASQQVYLPDQISREDYRYRQILINKVKNFWIKGVLETSIHDRAIIELGLKSRLDLLERPWGMVWGNPETEGELLPTKVKIIDKFREMGEGRSLLILGEPGSGKTTTLLQLTRDLLQQAEIDIYTPIPVVFNLSSWMNEKESIHHWLVSELNTKYQVSKAIAQSWSEKGELTLLLDGLDEVHQKRRSTCVTAINQFYQEHGTTEIVVCSRIQDYQDLSTRLNLQAAICLQPLTLDQIHQYFQEAGAELSVIRTALIEDKTLQELAKSPLMLSIMTLAYQGISASSLPHFKTIEQRRKHLFETYVQRMLNHSSYSIKYSKDQFIDWLIWLAKSLQEHSQTVFLIERMQPDLLPNFMQKFIYTLSLFLIFFIIGGWVGLQILPISLLPVALGIGCFIFCLISNTNQIQPVETLKWSWKKASLHLTIGIIFGTIILAIAKFINQLILYFVNNDEFGWIFPGTESLGRGIIFGMSLGIIYGLVRGFQGDMIPKKNFPNQGIFQSAMNAILFAMIGFAFLGVAASLLDWYLKGWVILGLCFGLVVGGGEACIKHFVLRLILYLNGKIPWNYARFLNEATRRVLLQKVGGGYIFIHRLLLEHLAQKN